MKIVTGYQSGPSARLALERGEIQGIAGVALFSAKTDYASSIKAGDIRILAAYGIHKHPELQDVPLFPVGSTPEDQQIFKLLYARQDYGISFLTPPDVPQERVAALQASLEATFRDADFIADAKKLTIDIDPVPAAELTALTNDLFQTPAAVISRMQNLLDDHTK